MAHFDLYLFDFDGTIVDTEPIHYAAYKNAFKNIKNDFDLTYDDYCKYKHGNDTENIDKYFTHEQQKSIAIEKEKIFFEIIENEKVTIIEGIQNFIENILLNGKEICVVTHSSKKRIEHIKEHIPFLQKITHWITKECYNNKKPNPECYIHAINKFNIPLKNIIAFEDSYIGFSAINKLNINKVFINSKNYIYYDKIDCINKFENYNELCIVGLQTNYNDNYGVILTNKIDRYISQIEKLKPSYEKNIHTLCELIKECKGIIYFLGIGKNNHISNKCVSTWKSYGIKANTVYVQDLTHGDMGIFKQEDYIVYVSNSGNTIELINVAKYIKEHFNFFQISICNAKQSDISKYTNIEFNLSDSKITEADEINMAPSISSVCIMMFLDLVGITYAEEKKYTRDDFKLYHPGGALGIKKPIDCVFIFAAGKGSRLKPYTNNIPKILVNIDNDNLLSKIVKYWNTYTDQFVIVVNEEYNKMIDVYMKTEGVKYEIININIDKQENSYTIKNAVDEKYFGKNILFTWCDIYPNEKMNQNIFSHKNIIFTFGNQCRYKAENNNIFKCQNGNIIGIYYFHQYTPLIYQEDSMDLCDCYLKNYNNFITHDLNSLIDIGDIEKYINIANDLENIKYKTRAFNKIEDIDNDKLIKYSLNKKGYDIIQIEMNWYKVNEFDFLPKIYKFNENSFVMEKLIGYKSLYESFYNFNKNKKENVLKQLLSCLHMIHIKSKIISKDILINDVKYEFFDKILDRCTDIKCLLNCFDIKYVNGIEINITLDTILINLNDIINKYVSEKNTYNIIHGDCQFSNFLYNENINEIKLIDPRGYFGSTKNFGLIEYDYSKILYALSGYDTFNNTPSFINLENSNININITVDMESFNFVTEQLKIDKKVLLSMVIIHWLGLAQYNKNDIAKCINSYYYGIFLYFKFML